MSVCARLRIEVSAGWTELSFRLPNSGDQRLAAGDLLAAKG